MPGAEIRSRTVFDVADGERLVSASRLRDVDGDEDGDDDGEGVGEGVGEELEDGEVVEAGPETEVAVEEDAPE